MDGLSVAECTCFEFFNAHSDEGFCCLGRAEDLTVWCAADLFGSNESNKSRRLRYIYKEKSFFYLGI